MDMTFTACTDSRRLLTNEVYSLYSPCMYRPSYKKYRDFINSCLLRPDMQIYICRNENRIVGMLTAKISPAGCEITGIAADRRMRGRGIGRYMVSRLAELHRPSVIWAQTDDEAVGFYRKTGFSVRRVSVQYPDGVKVRYNCCLKTG